MRMSSEDKRDQTKFDEFDFTTYTPKPKRVGVLPMSIIRSPKMTPEPQSNETEREVTPHICENCKWCAYWQNPAVTTMPYYCLNKNSPVGGIEEEEIKTFGCNQWEQKQC